MRYWLGAISTALVAYLAISGSQAQVPKGTIIKGGVMNPAPTAKDYADLAKLPDWSGVWDPKTSDQNAQIRSNPPPWNAKAQAEVRKMFDEFRAGKPRPIVVNCLPHGMPSWMLITHNPMEILFTPGRVTMLGDGDGNRMRRIYTDGRAASRRARSHLPRPLDRPLGGRHAGRRHGRHPAAVLHRHQRGGRRAEQRRHAHHGTHSPCRQGNPAR